MNATAPAERFAVVMAGGAGERFWPLSRATRPKQLLNLGPSGRSLLEETIERVLPLVERERLFVVTGKHLREHLAAANLPIGEEQILAEPCKRNTAGCIAYATAYVLAKFDCPPERATLIIVPADHYIRDAKAFREALSKAVSAAEQEQALVVIGVEPTRPETGYGYIQVAEERSPAGGRGERDEVWPVASFREKPSPELAREFLASGGFLWNTGMFVWRASAFLEEMRGARPEMAQTIDELIAAMRTGEEEKAEEIFESLPDISIDYALMERAQRVLVVRAGFDWDDLGAWDAFRRVCARDGKGNVTVGDPVLIDCRDCVVYNESGQEKVAVSVIGMDGVVVAVSRDGVLVVPASRAQEVREAVAALKKQGARQI